MFRNVFTTTHYQLLKGSLKSTFVKSVGKEWMMVCRKDM